jgi:hypothetical protein
MAGCLFHASSAGVASQGPILLALVDRVLLLSHLDLMLAYQGAIDAIGQLKLGIDADVRIARCDVFLHE